MTVYCLRLTFPSGRIITGTYTSATARALAIISFGQYAKVETWEETAQKCN